MNWTWTCNLIPRASLFHAPWDQEEEKAWEWGSWTFTFTVVPELIPVIIISCCTPGLVMIVFDTWISFLALIPKWENTAFASLSCIASWKKINIFNILLYHIVTEDPLAKPVGFFLRALLYNLIDACFVKLNKFKKERVCKLSYGYYLAKSLFPWKKYHTQVIWVGQFLAQLAGTVFFTQSWERGGAEVTLLPGTTFLCVNSLYDSVMGNLFLIDLHTYFIELLEKTFCSIPTLSYFLSICHGSHTTLKICPYAFTIIIVGGRRQMDRLNK